MSSGSWFGNPPFVYFSVTSGRFFKYILSFFLVKFIKRADMSCPLCLETRVPLFIFGSMPYCGPQVVAAQVVSGVGFFVVVFNQHDHPGSRIQLWAPSKALSWLLRHSNLGEVPPRTGSMWQSTQRHGGPGPLPATQESPEASKTKPLLSFNVQNNQ